MEARKRFIASLTLALGLSAGAANAQESTADYYAETLAPTVVQASCDNGCATNSCDLGCCDSGIGGGLFGRGGCGLGGCDDCGSGCDSLGCGKQGLLGLGLIKPSDTCFNDFISPMTNPVFFEDPRTLSEVRFIFINHVLPDSLGGNSVQVYAMQARAALTKRLSLIATKDGFIYTQSPVLDSGFADIAAGLKYNLYRDTVRGRLLSAGMTFEIPSGSNKSLQGNGNGEFHFFVTGGARIGDKAHWVSAAGLREPADTSLENRSMYWSNHLDRQIGNRPLYAFTELNWYNYTSSASAFPLPVEGGDLFNLGSPNITGHDLVTHAIGLKAKPKIEHRGWCCLGIPHDGTQRLDGQPPDGGPNHPILGHAIRFYPNRNQLEIHEHQLPTSWCFFLDEICFDHGNRMRIEVPVDALIKHNRKTLLNVEPEGQAVGIAPAHDPSVAEQLSLKHCDSPALIAIHGGIFSNSIPPLK